VVRKAAGIAMAALGMALLVGASACTRTSDGSIVMRKPTFLGFGGNDPAPRSQLDVGPPVYAEVAPVPARPAYRRPAPQQAKVTIPSMSIARNPPFKRANPDKPLSCRNEKTSTGRIRVVCI